jgi:Flp pilus assembly protein TadD
VLDTLGWVYYKKNSFPRAIPLFEKSARRDPNNPMMYFHLGMAYYRNGESESARRALEKSLALSATHADANAARQVLAELRHNTKSR